MSGILKKLIGVAPKAEHFCGLCGNKLPGRPNFCPFCGAPLKPESRAIQEFFYKEVHLKLPKERRKK